MEREHERPWNADQGAPADVLTRLAAIEEQGRQTLELVRVIVGLLVPQESGREGVPLEDLIAGVFAMQRDLLAVACVIQAEVKQLGETLPADVAEAVQNGRAVRVA